MCAFLLRRCNTVLYVVPMTNTAPAPVTRDDVVALIAEAEAASPATFCAVRSLNMAREALARYDADPHWWTAEVFRITLRDAANSARLSIRYHAEGV